MNLIAPFQLRDARLKWRKKVPLALQGAPFCAFVELTLTPDSVRREALGLCTGVAFGSKIVAPLQSLWPNATLLPISLLYIAILDGV